VVRVPRGKNELTERCFAKLIEQIKTMMTACLKPEYRSFYGQLILNRAAVAKLGELADVRRKTRAAGRQLGWHVRSHAADNSMLRIMIYWPIRSALLDPDWLIASGAGETGLAQLDDVNASEPDAVRPASPLRAVGVVHRVGEEHRGGVLDLDSVTILFKVADFDMPAIGGDGDGPKAGSVFPDAGRLSVC
jgi:hypothetical protein